jgi:Scavenger mRNA decapping enzyme C-term binding
MNKFKMIFLSLISMCVGILIGGYLFSQSQPRSFLAINHCQNCLAPKDLLGLIASVGIQKFPGLMPFVVFETDKTVVIKYPFPQVSIHYVIIPKKDIKNFGEISKADIQYLNDAFFVAKWIIEQQKLSRYEFYTNGPGSQTVTYLHFHLVGK